MEMSPFLGREARGGLFRDQAATGLDSGAQPPPKGLKESWRANIAPGPSLLLLKDSVSLLKPELQLGRPGFKFCSATY